MCRRGSITPCGYLQADMNREDLVCSTVLKMAYYTVAKKFFFFVVFQALGLFLKKQHENYVNGCVFTSSSNKDFSFSQLKLILPGSSVLSITHMIPSACPK